MKLSTVLSTILLLLVFCFPIYGERIITMAPSLTEIVFQLGKGDSIVGNTKFCNFPEEAKNIPRVGGYIDMNMELIINAKPDVIILYKDHLEKIKIMKSSAKLVVVNHSAIKDILNSIKTIAKALDVEERGVKLTSQIKEGLSRVRKISAGKNAKKVMLIISRNPDNLANMYINGRQDFLSELLEVAGGINAYDGTIAYPSVSVESVVAMNPDIILELSAHNEGIDKKKVMASWKKFPFITAVKKEKIILVKKDLWLLPGPRIVTIAEEMAAIFHEK
ncbi:MAG: ABC transporter substrate-binding protein [bacterium]|nr:ABC transporter substrate-binding protein [bacterium]